MRLDLDVEQLISYIAWAPEDGAKDHTILHRQTAAIIRGEAILDDGGVLVDDEDAQGVDSPNSGSINMP